MQAASGRREVFPARLWECRRHSARRRAWVRRQDVAEIFPEGRKDVVRAQAAPDRAPRRGACQKAARQRDGAALVRENRRVAMEIFEARRGLPRDERHRERQRPDVELQEQPAKQEQHPERSGAEAPKALARPEQRLALQRLARRADELQQEQQPALRQRTDEPQPEAQQALLDERAQRRASEARRAERLRARQALAERRERPVQQASPRAQGLPDGRQASLWPQQLSPVFPIRRQLPFRQFAGNVSVRVRRARDRASSNASSSR